MKPIRISGGPRTVRAAGAEGRPPVQNSKITIIKKGTRITAGGLNGPNN